MTLKSMTGFAAEAGDHAGYGWSWELRSVNSRSLDLRMRLPSGLERMEPALRSAVSGKFARGNISVHLSLKSPDRDTRYRIDEQAFEQLLTAARSLADRLDAPPPGTDSLLGLRGVIEVAEDEPTDEEREALEASLTDSFDKALENLHQNRSEEGGRLHAVMTRLVDEIETLVDRAGGSAEAQPPAIHKRMAEKVDEILSGEDRLSADRLAQEVAVLALKADIREELDRLRSHIAAARGLLGSEDPVGRKLDFLCQEFNREANTICSKAATIEVTEIGLALKAAIDRVREQVQNIE